MIDFQRLFVVATIARWLAVNMSSTAGLTGVSGIGAYIAGKHGIIGLTDPLRSTTRATASGSTPWRPVRF